MLGLSQFEERLIWVAIVIVIIMGFTWHERHVGAEQCIQRDQKATATQETHNAAVLAQGVTTVYQEATDYNDAISAPVARPVHVRVCESPAPSPVPDPAAAGPVSDGSPPLPGSDHAAPVPSDIGPELQAVGRDADAQIVELQDYVRRVCSVR